MGKIINWVHMADELPPHGQPVLMWSPEWVDQDFCPTGVREGYYIDGDDLFVSCGWDPCHDVYTTDEESIPLMWAKIEPPKP